MEMLNERAIRIIEEIPIETDEQKAALELATEALKSYKCIELAPLDDKAFYAFRQDQVLHIQCPELLSECVDYLEALDEKNPSFTIWDYKRSK